ncbi:MAG: L,D-transpeptidase family protein [Alphaproteobacteria bacterium]|nr:L,D-transpeptidase family protein [Alphaproteobacteria bacterium]
MLTRPTLLTCLLTLLIAAPLALHELARTPIEPRAPSHTVESRLDGFGPSARARLAAPFSRAGVPYPPARVRLAAFKAEGRLELFAAAGPGGAGDAALRFIKSYRMTAGPLPVAQAPKGPKRRAGDRRVPEGLYRLHTLNPNSVAHVSIRIGYPNRFDRARAEAEGRAPESLGDAIMLHGGGPSGTEGCLALADREMEELFTLLADARADAARRGDTAPADILIAPRDFRTASLDHAALEAMTDGAPWTARLHREIDRSLAALPTADPAARYRAWLAAD